MKKTNIILFGILSTLAFNLNGQCNLTPVEITSTPNSSGYMVSSQSRIIELKRNADHEMVFIAQDDVNYRISVVLDSNMANSNILFDVFEMVVSKNEENGKVSYRKENQVLFNGVQVGEQVEFKSEGNRKLHIQFKKDVDLSKDVCVQVVIENKKKN
jgi:hypothetical protein